MNNKEVDLLTCIITNGTHNMELLIWDEGKINDLLDKFVVGKVRNYIFKQNSFEISWERGSTKHIILDCTSGWL